MAGEATLAEQVSSFREFNRFYTSRLGLLRKRHLDGQFSLTEARILYEIGASPQITASALCTTLGLDPGYISRLLASFIGASSFANSRAERMAVRSLLP